MSDDETPAEELLRNAEEISQDLLYVRSDAAYRVPYGMMMRLKAAIARYKESMPAEEKR